MKGGIPNGRNSKEIGCRHQEQYYSDYRQPQRRNSGCAGNAE